MMGLTLTRMWDPLIKFIIKSIINVKKNKHHFIKENVNECCTALIKNLIKENFYEKR